MQEELDTSTDGSTDSSGEDYSYDEEDDTTTTTTGTDHSSKDDDAVVDNQKEPTLKSQYAGSVVVDNRPRDEPMILDQLTEQVDSLSHHLDEPLPPPNSDQLVDYFENPDLETEQSLLSAVDNNTTTTTYVVESKVKSPVSDLETEQSLLSAIDNSATSVVDNTTTSPVTDIENENFASETNNLISSIDDKVIEEIIATEILLEHKGDQLPANKKTENEELVNEEFVHVADNVFATEIEKSTKSELSGLVEEHYSKEVAIH